MSPPELGFNSLNGGYIHAFDGRDDFSLSGRDVRLSVFETPE